MARAPINLQSLSRAYTEMALRTLAGIAQHSENDSARVTACGLLLDRGWGKAPQAHTGENGEGDIRVVVRHIICGERASPVALDNSKPHTIEHAPDDDWKTNIAASRCRPSMVPGRDREHMCPREPSPRAGGEAANCNPPQMAALAAVIFCRARTGNEPTTFCIEAMRAVSPQCPVPQRRPWVLFFSPDQSS